MEEITQKSVEMQPITMSNQPWYGNDEPLNAFAIRDYDLIQWVLEDTNKIKYATTGSMSWTSLVVTESDVTPTSVVFWTAHSTPVGYIELELWTGTMTFRSSATESGLVFSYAIIR